MSIFYLVAVITPSGASDCCYQCLAREYLLKVCYLLADMGGVCWVPVGGSASEESTSSSPLLACLQSGLPEDETGENLHKV